MAGVLARVERAYALSRGRSRSGDGPLSWDLYQQFFNFGGVDYPLIQTTMGGLNREKVPASAIAAYKGHGPVFALVLARMQVFSQIRFQWTRFTGALPGDLFGTPELSVLETPWPGGTTADLLARMEMHDSLAGNAYVRRTAPDRLNVLRPDFVTIILGSQENADHPADAADVTVAGYLYTPAGGRPQIFLPSEIAHFAPIPDPWFHFLGQSWITPVLQELQGDSAAVEHKVRFFENSATSNIAIKFDPSVTIDLVRQFKELIEEEHQGIRNAFKTLYLGGGADPVPVGSSFKDMDYAIVQGRAESRLAAAAGVPPSWVGFSEGLQGSALNAGNFDSARRRFSDGPQPYDAGVLTPSGWTTMGEIQPGMQVIGSDGKPHAVLEVFDQPEQDIYRVDFIDGTWAECTLGHYWTVRDGESHRRGWQTIPLGKIISTGFRSGTRSPRWAVPLADPVEIDPSPVTLPIDPYLLGLLLGDGTFTGEIKLSVGANDADETQARIAELLPTGVAIRRQDRADATVLHFPGSIPGRRRLGGPAAAHSRVGPVSVMGAAVRELGLGGVTLREKFIPVRYLRAPVKDRVSLLQGLIDSDGCITEQGSIRFSNTSERLLNDVASLVRSLGGMAWDRQCSRGDRELAISRLPDWIIPVRLLRKVARLRPGKWQRVKSMTGAELVRRAPTRCLLIDSPDHLYVTDGFTLTHNTLVHLWGNAAASLQPILQPPDSGASLWYDSRVPFMREDAGDQADIQATQATTITNLIRDGFTPESAIKAVTNNDWSLLEHSGLVSVQLWEPGTESPAHPEPGADSPAAPAGPPALPASPAPPALPAGGNGKAPATAASNGKPAAGRALSGYPAGTAPGAGSGMISLDLPAGTVPPVPGGLADHHITVVYLGPDVDDEAFAAACERAQATAAAVGPVTGTVGGLGVFAPSDSSDGKMPVFAHADIPAAAGLRASLADLSGSEHQQWVPHVTLAYADPGDPLPPPVPATPVTFTHLAVHRGDDVRRFQLGSGSALAASNGKVPAAAA